jgi:DNA (cytosine-5)-methyltransferase 1
MKKTEGSKRLFNIYGYTGGNFGGNVYDTDYLSPTIINFSGGGNRQPLVQVNENMRIRKLTPKECWRLMGFDDCDFDKARQVNSDTQLYKQAGNSIVVNVLTAIFGEMLPEDRRGGHN